MLQAFVNIPHLDGVAWTLTYELIFYFLIAVMLAFGWLKHLVVVMGFWLGYCTVASVALNTGPFAFFLFPKYAPFFIAGMSFYLLQSSQAAPWKLYVILFISYVLSVRACLQLTSESALYYHHNFSGIVTTAIITVFHLVFLLIVKRKFSVGQSKWIAWAGALTYPIYLSHHTIGYIAFRRIGDSLNRYVTLAILLAGVLIIAYLIHRFIEKKFSKPLGHVVQQLLSDF